MTRDANLYFNLVSREDSLTELLANCLQFPAFRKVFSGLVADKLGMPGFTFGYESVETQKSLSDLSRPDLVIEDESVCVFIECKVSSYRGLTSNQPENYLKHLSTQAGKQTALMFLVPHYYAHKTDLRAIATNTGLAVPCEVVPWTELIARMERDNIAGANLALRHFLALLHAWFDVTPISFAKEDIMLLQNPEFPVQLIKLIALVNKVSYQFPEPYKVQKLFNEYGFGYYVKNEAGEYVLWFGCSYDYWKDHNRPLQIGVGDDDREDFSRAVINRFKKKFGEDTWYQPWQWYAVPIPETLFEDADRFEELVKFVVDAAAWCNGDV